MTYKQIEQSREARLWLCQIVVPVITFTATIVAIPEVREAIADKAKRVKNMIKTKLTKR